MVLMETTMMLGQLIGPTMVVAGIGFLFNGEYFQKMLKDFSKEKGLAFVMGMITFVVGLAIVLNSNVWMLSWEVVPTLIGWGALLKGAGYMVFPEAMMDMAKGVKLQGGLLTFAAIVYIALGAWVSYNVFM